MENRKVKIYSIGAYNEEHGPALPTNIDDYFAKHTAVRAAEQIGADYLGHLPYTSDRVGEIALDWNHTYIPMDEMKANICYEIEHDRKEHKHQKMGDFSHIVIISGHGGNNFLADDNNINYVVNGTGLPFLYIPPLDDVSVNDKRYGNIIASHADDAEHSIARYLGVLKLEQFDKLNKMSADDPEDVLRRFPAIMGLAGYVLPQFGSSRYDSLREYCGPEGGELFLKRKFVIGDYEIGRKFTEGNIEMAVNRINKFLGDKNGK